MSDRVGGDMVEADIVGVYSLWYRWWYIDIVCVYGVDIYKCVYKWWYISVDISGGIYKCCYKWYKCWYKSWYKCWYRW